MRDFEPGKKKDGSVIENNSRRSFLQGCAAALAVGALAGPAMAAAGRGAGEAELIKPRVLLPGDTIGLITPARFVTDPDQFWLVERTLEHFGLKKKFGRSVGRRHGFVGGTVDERLDDLHAMLRDPEVKGIFCLRGGYGTMQMLDRIDYDLFRRHPKIFLGYSDITAMHLAILKNTGLVTFHGPVVLSRFTGYTQAHFRKILFDPSPAGTLANPQETNPIRPAHVLRAINPGKADGRLIGGNLSLITATLGTPWEIDTRGRILFLEDVGEQPYRLDRMLQQMRLAGKLREAAGIIFGGCLNCSSEFRPYDTAVSVGEVVDEVLGDLGIPVLYGLTIGHTADQLTLPLGLMATLDADAGTVTIDEAATLPA